MSDIRLCLLGETAVTQTDADDEQKITVVAVRLALLEKTSSGLATMAFIWATVVILGGFASTIQARDFWFATVISLVEGTRIVRRSSELEWRHKATWKVPLVPYTKMLFIPEKVSELFFWLQLLLAFPCIGLSLYSLVLQSYGDVSKSAFNIFYGLSLADSLLYLLEKAYWYRKIFQKKLLLDMTLKYGFTDKEIDKFDHFFYDTYSLCINESILDGLNMEFVSYSVELLLSSGDDTQLRGAQVLPTLLEEHKHKEKALSAIRAKGDVPKRLIEMLNRNGKQNFRSPAAEIISKLVQKDPSFIRFKAISGSMESIGSLLSEEESSEIHSAPRQDANDEFNDMGLQILKSMVKDKENCSAIGSSKSLLPKIIRFIKSSNANRKTMAENLLSEIAEMRDVLDELFKMLTSMDHHQQEIRKAAAKAISYLVRNNWNSNRLMAIPDSIKCIKSLLYAKQAIETHKKHYGDKSSGADNTSEHSREKGYDYPAFSLLGLKILESLVKGGAHTESILDLFPELIGFIKSNQSPFQIEPVTLALKLFNVVMKNYQSQGWDKMKNITFGISDLEDFLEYQEGSMRPELQILAIETLMILAKKGISLSSSDKGALCNLFSLFSKPEDEMLVKKAGEALDSLSHDSRDNCRLMMSTEPEPNHSNLIEWLISMLHYPLQGIVVMRILRNLCKDAKARELIFAAVARIGAKVLGFMMNEEGDHQEAAIGLLAELFITKSNFDSMLQESSGVTTISLISKLLEVFRQSRSNEGRMRLSTGLLRAVIQMDKDAISNSMSKEVKVNLEKILKRRSLPPEIFSFLQPTDAHK